MKTNLFSAVASAAVLAIGSASNAAVFFNVGSAVVTAGQTSVSLPLTFTSDQAYTATGVDVGLNFGTTLPAASSTVPAGLFTLSNFSLASPFAGGLGLPTAITDLLTLTASTPGVTSFPLSILNPLTGTITLSLPASLTAGVYSVGVDSALVTLNGGQSEVTSSLNIPGTITITVPEPMSITAAASLAGLVVRRRR